MRMLRTGRIAASLAVFSTLLLIPTLARSQEHPPEGTDSSYGYVSLSQGGVTLIESDTRDFVPVEGSEAVLAGDELRLASGARAEVQLADRNLVRLDDRAEVVFLTLAGSPDRSDAITSLMLRRGSMQVVVAEDYLGETPPAIETSNAYVELRGPGTYLIEAGSERTLLVARSGGARVRAGSAVTSVRSGEQAVVEGRDGSRVELAAAGGLAGVERWGESRGAAYATAYAGATEVYVDESIRYAAAPLRSYGTWVYVRGVRAWRPHVGYGWRPYSRGRWRYTPTGLFWVSYEPWGWVPHHYGNWDLVPGYGWVWFPGRRFASAWVFWYWGPRYVGWVPWGYYSNHYGSRYGLSFAVYGRAGGPAGHFGDWCFTPLNRFGHRHQQRYIRTGRALDRDGERIERGIITTDTRGLTPGHWTSPDQVDRMLTLDDGGKHFELEDVSPFVDREKDARLPDRRGTSAARRSEPVRPSIDPVRTTRTVELASTPRELTPRDIATREITTRDPKPRDISARQPTVREKAQREVNRSASIDPVRTTRTVELASTPREITPREITPRDFVPRDISARQPTVGEKAQREVNRRASIDPVRTTRPVQVAPSGATRVFERPSVDGAARKPTQLKRPEAVRRTNPVSSPSPRRAAPAKAAPGSVRSPSRSKTTSRAQPGKTRSE